MQGKFKKSRVFQLGSRFVGQTPHAHSDEYREDFVTDQTFRVGRPGAAVCRTRIQILTEKCILRIPLSSDFLQIIGRKQIDGAISKIGNEESRNGKWGTGNGEREMKNGEQGICKIGNL